MRYPSDAERLRAVLSRFVRQLRGESSLTRAAVLSHLERGVATTAVELAALERVRPQSMAATLDALEADGLITRAPDPSDRRRLRVAISLRGKQRIAKARAAKVATLDRAIATRLDRDERKQLGAAITLLERLLDD